VTWWWRWGRGRVVGGAAKKKEKDEKMSWIKGMDHRRFI